MHCHTFESKIEPRFPRMAIWVICDPGTYLVTGKLQNAVPSPITMKPSHLKITAHSFLPSRNPWYYVDKDTGRLELDYIQRDLRQPLWKKVRRGPSACCETLEMLTRMPLDLLYEVRNYPPFKNFFLTIILDIQPSTADGSLGHFTYNPLAKTSTDVARRERRVEVIVYACSGPPILPDRHDGAAVC